MTPKKVAKLERRLRYDGMLLAAGSFVGVGIASLYFEGIGLRAASLPVGLVVLGVGLSMLKR